MAEPVILVVDDEPAVLRAVERELRGHFGAAYTVVAADSGKTALDVLRRLALRDTPVALLLVGPADAWHDRDRAARRVAGARPRRPAGPPHGLRRHRGRDPGDQRDPSRPVPPEALGAPGGAPLPGPRRPPRGLAGDLPAAVRGHPPRRPPLVGPGPRDQGLPGPQPGAISVGRRRGGHRGGTARCRRRGATRGAIPLLVFPDGSHLLAPSNAEIADRLGLRTRPDLATYDLVIVGGGPAGLAAAVYGASEGLRTLLVEREAPGGQAGTTSRIENYLGFPSGLSGADLARRAVAQATRLGAELLTARDATALASRGPLPAAYARRRQPGLLRGAHRGNRRPVPAPRR